MSAAGDTALNARLLQRDASVERWSLLGLASPAILVVMVVMVLPVGWLFYLSFLGDDGQFSLENYNRMIESKAYGRIFWTTFKVSVLTTLICILIGYPLAWLVLLQRKGLLNRWAMDIGLWDEPVKLVHNLNGTLIGMVHIMLPFLVLPLYGSMKAISEDYMKASSNLGAGPVQTFWHVFFPLSLPGLFAGALIVFVLCLGFFVTPAVLGGGRVIMVAMQITTNIELFFNWGAASSLGVVLLILTLGILFAASRALRLDNILGGGHG